MNVIQLDTEKIETTEEIAAVIVKAAELYLRKKSSPGTTCGMAPTRREIAALKLEARGLGRRPGAPEIRLIISSCSQI